MPTLDQIKADARQRIHGRAAVSATLVDTSHPAGLVFAADYTGEGLRVRYHNRIAQTGDLSSDYAEIIDGIDRLVFLDSNVAEVSDALVANGEAPLIIQRGAVVQIAGYKGVRFVLDSQEPPDGPSETIWTVARKRA